MSWISESLLAAATEEEVHGGRAWTTLKAGEMLQKAFSLWANSTLGMIVHWTQGQRTQKGRSTTQIGALKKIPCPDLARLPLSQLERAARLFDELAKITLKPACQAHCDENRWRIDAVVCETLFPPKAKKTIAQLRQLWCAETSVHGDNKKALRLLKKPSD